MNVQKLIDQYDTEIGELATEGIALIKSGNLASVSYQILEARTIEKEKIERMLKTLQKDMRKYLGQFSDKLNKANVMLAFGLGEKE